MSQYSKADTERVYRIAREYVEETQRYVRMIIEADPGNAQFAKAIITDLDRAASNLINLKKDWQKSLAVRNPDWDGLGQ